MYDSRPPPDDDPDDEDRDWIDELGFYDGPLYDLILLDDDTHTYAYVISMLRAIFGYGYDLALAMATTVDCFGRVVVYTGSLDRAQFHRDEILACGADPGLARSTGPMRAIVEPAG